MTSSRNITAEQLRALLSYDPITGIFVWVRDMSIGTHAGMPAGTIYANGRRYITISRKRYFASHLAWLYHYGTWPAALIDHKNRNRSDDRIENLREASPVQNGANRCVSSNNVCGIKGVQKRVSRRGDVTWRARIRVHGTLIYLGQFSNPGLASAAYADAARKYFGDFALAA